MLSTIQRTDFNISSHLFYIKNAHQAMDIRRVFLLRSFEFTFLFDSFLFFIHSSFVCVFVFYFLLWKIAAIKMLMVLSASVCIQNKLFTWSIYLVCTFMAHILWMVNHLKCLYIKLILNLSECALHFSHFSFARTLAPFP